MTGNKNPVHGRKLCSPSTGNFQYTKMEKPALETVLYRNLYTISEGWHWYVLFNIYLITYKDKYITEAFNYIYRDRVAKYYIHIFLFCWRLIEARLDSALWMKGQTLNWCWKDNAVFRFHTVLKEIHFPRYNMKCIVGETWYYTEYFMYHVFLFILCYTAEILITFRTVHNGNNNATIELVLKLQRWVGLHVGNNKTTIELVLKWQRWVRLRIGKLK